MGVLTSTKGFTESNQVKKQYSVGKEPAKREIIF